jgi:hypothetical protein
VNDEPSPLERQIAELHALERAALRLAEEIARAGSRLTILTGWIEAEPAVADAEIALLEHMFMLGEHHG